MSFGLGRVEQVQLGRGDTSSTDSSHGNIKSNRGHVSQDQLDLVKVRTSDIRIELVPPL